MATGTSSTIQFPYRRSLGPVVGAFMTALTDRRILGIRAGDRVICPPVEWDPVTAETLAHEFVEVGPTGTVESWTWVATPTSQHPLQEPFAFALIRLDGADTTMFHAIRAPSPDAMHTGMRVAPRWRAQRTGGIGDIECFVPGDDPVVPADDAGPVADPVTTIDYHASITYTDTTSPSAIRYTEASARNVLLGQRCPTCDRVYTGGRGYCPTDATELGEEHEVELPDRGVITNFTIVTPVQYPGQTETEPFARVMVLLDGTDVIMTYQPVIELPVADLHVGIRVAAVWASPAEGMQEGGWNADSYLLGWMATGEPDVDDPDLVHRIY